MSQNRFAMADLTGGETNALVKIVGGADAVRRILRGECVVSVEAKNKDSRTVLADLLEEVGDPVNVPATKRFVARDKFKVDRNGELPISYLGDNFRKHFLDVLEKNVAATTLKQRKLLKSSVDARILAALGDRDLAKIENARTALSQVFNYLKKADRSRWFIFYVADAKGTVWVVRASWDCVGWGVEASSVSYPGEWSGARYVVSP